MNSIFIKLTGNKDRHNILDEFEFWPDLTSHFGVTCPWAVKENDISSFSQSLLIRYLSNLQITRTCIKARSSSNLGRFGLFTMELLVLERSPWLWMGKMNGENGVSIFSQLLRIQTSSNLQFEDRHKISDEFEFRSYLTNHFGVTCPWAVKKKCLQLFSVTFDWIFVKLAANADRHKSLNELEFGPDRIIHFGVIRPWAQKFFPID